MTHDRFGSVLSAYQFDGNDGFFEANQPITIGSSSNTLEFWVKIPKIGSAGLSSNERVGILFGDYNASPNANWEIHDDGQTRIHWNNGEIDTLGYKDLRDDKWHHLIFVRDLTENKFYSYVDGEPDITYHTSG